jgi:RHS repeat-associated protein
VGELRYMPWGSPRASGYAETLTPTDKRFTGQRWEGGTGLYHYGARWYDPATGRFTQPDTIVPSQLGVQAWDRFGYVLNNPIQFTDPSGHLVCSDKHVAPGDCSDEGAGLWRYNITLSGNWSKENIRAAREAVYAMGDRLAKEIGGTPWNAFREIYGYVNFTWGLEGAKGECTTITAGGCTTSAHQINFMSMAQPHGNKTTEMAALEARNNIIHELGHAFADIWYRKDGSYDPKGPYVNIPGDNDMLSNRGFHPSPVSARLTWRQHPCTAGDFGCANEVFADMFLGWTFDTWESDRFGKARDLFMTTNMSEWIIAVAGQ